MNNDNASSEGNKTAQNVMLNGTKDKANGKKKFVRKNCSKSRKKRQKFEAISKDLKEFLKGDCLSFLNDAVREANLIKDMDLYDNLEADLQSLIRSKYSQCEVNFFGSRICGLGSPTSDVDIYLNIGNALRQNAQLQERTLGRIALRQLHFVKNELIKSKDWINILTIEQARVPLIRGYNIKYKVECDITFSSGAATYNTILLQYLLELQPLFQKMCIFMKKWNEILQLPKEQLSSYSVVLLILFYLQHENVMPTIHQLQVNLPNPFKIGPWTCNFVKRTLQDLRIPLAGHNNEQVYYHLKAFFAFYKQFDFKNACICPYIGKILRKEDFNVITAVRMPTYHTVYKLQPEKMGLSMKPMTVQDIFELNRNVTENVSENILSSMHKFFLFSEANIKKNHNYVLKKY